MVGGWRDVLGTIRSRVANFVATLPRGRAPRLRAPPNLPPLATYLTSHHSSFCSSLFQTGMAL